MKLQNSKKTNNQHILRGKKQNVDTLEYFHALRCTRETVLNCFKSRIFWLPQIESTGHSGIIPSRPSNLDSCIKALTPKQLLDRLSTVLALVKADNNLKVS